MPCKVTAKDVLALILRASIAAALSLFAMVYFVRGLPEFHFLWPALFMAAGIFSFAGVVAHPFSETTLKELGAIYMPPGGAADRRQKQAKLYGRLSLAYFLLGFMWMAVGVAALSPACFSLAALFGSHTVLGIIVGSSVMMALGLTFGLLGIALKITVWPLK